MPSFLTTIQVAEHLGISTSRVRALIKAGRLLAEKFGKAWMIQQSDLDAFVPRPAGRPKAHEGHGAGEPAER